MDDLKVILYGRSIEVKLADDKKRVGEEVAWCEIVAFLAWKFDYSLIKSSNNYIGNLRMSQVQALFDGFGKIKQKESEAIKRTSKPGVREAGIHDLKHVPGVQVIKRKKK